jgi:hypothetical protein
MTTRRDSMSTRLGRELQNWFSLARTIADSGRIRNRPEQPLRERVHAASGFLRDGLRELAAGLRQPEARPGRSGYLAAALAGHDGPAVSTSTKNDLATPPSPDMEA